MAFYEETLGNFEFKSWGIFNEISGKFLNNHSSRVNFRRKIFGELFKKFLKISQKLKSQKTFEEILVEFSKQYQIWI